MLILIYVYILQTGGESNPVELLRLNSTFHCLDTSSYTMKQNYHVQNDRTLSALVPND